MEKNKINILNISFENIIKTDLLRKIEKHISDQQKTFLVTANPEIVMLANQDSEYQSIVKKADYVIADGIGVVIGSKLLGTPLPERIAGYDLLVELLKMGNEKGWSVYFLGAKQEVIQKAVENIQGSYPGLHVAGWHDGYFNWDSSEIPDEIKRKKPDLIFAALGFPRQEFWIAEHMKEFDKGIFMGVGGSFDVIAGTVKRAPVIWQKMNLEWLYRLIKQPSRWRRMLALPHFMLKVINEKIRSRK